MSRRRTSRPDYSWSNFGDVMPDVDLSTGNGQFGTTGSNVTSPQTLIRARGRVALTLNATAVGESTLLVCGLMRMNTDAFVAGTAPELVTNTVDEASWIWQGSLFVTSGEEAAVNQNFLTDSIEVDSKAMRKLKPGDTIAFVFHAAGALSQDQGGTYNLTYYFHCLNQS